MKKAWLAVAAVIGVPMIGHAQSLQNPGFYLGPEGGVNWLLNQTINVPALGASLNVNPDIGFAVGGFIGYDFVGPRLEVEAVYRSNTAPITLAIAGDPVFSFGAQSQQTSIMGNVLYDFFAGQTIVPYIGAGAGIAFINTSSSSFGFSSNSTQFAYQGILGIGWNISEQLRLNLDGRYYATTDPNIDGAAGGAPWQNHNISIMLGLQLKFGGASAAPAAAPTAAAPQSTSFIVFFDWDRFDITPQAANTIRQAAQEFKARGSARITTTGHTDRSGPDNYNLALSLRRANAVKDMLVREGVPATAISVIGRGETQPLIQTADGVREPQNRRVEIVLG